MAKSEKPAGKTTAKAAGKGMAKQKLRTPTGLGDNAIQDLSAALNAVLADAFALYFKTKNFHWHVSGPHFRDYHLLLDEQAAEVIGITDAVAERVRKIGGQTLKTLAQTAQMTRLAENDADFVEPGDMLGELMEDNRQFIGALRTTKTLCDEHGDAASSAMIDTWIDEAERRVWFLYETLRPAMSGGH